MPSKLQAYSQMADHAAVQSTGSHQSWMAFLQTVARLYKYPYNEQVMIHAQRPNATACAEYDFWNEKWGRYVRRGSKGIALIDASGDRPKLKYVFDVADTGTRESSRTVRLWELRPDHLGSVTAMLERNYEVSGENGLQAQLERVAAQLADEYWNEHQRDTLDIVADSFLEEYDDFNIGVQFRNAATVSITYALMSRCGLKPDEYFEHEDFLSVFDFNTPETVAALGTAVSEINQQVLRQIEVTIKNYEREHSAERTNEYGRTDLQSERGLPDSRPDADRAAVGSAGQVWQDEEDVSEKAPSSAVEPPDSLGEAVSPSEGDRRDGEPEAGADDARDGESGRRDGEPESLRSDEMDGPYEQPESAGGGDHPDRTGFQLSFFPSEDEQIQKIDEAESVSQTPFAFSIAQQDIDEQLHPVKAGSEAEAIPPQPITQEDIDDALRAWNGDAASKRAVERYMAGHSRDKGTAAWLAGEYGSPGTKALLITKTGSEETVELPWAKVQRRVAQLIQADNFFTEQERDDFADIDPAVIRENFESPAAQERVDAMLEAAEKIAAESAVEPYERFSVVETDSGYAIWDDLHDGYYLDDEGVSEDFTSEQQADAYLEEIRKATADKEVAEWQYVERAKVKPAVKPFPYAVGDTVYLEDGKPFLVENVTDMHIELRDPTLLYPIWRSESVESFARLMARYPQPEKTSAEVKDNTKPEMTSEIVAVYPAEENNLPYDVVIERLHIDEPKHDVPDKATAEITLEPENFRITDVALGTGGPKAKFRANLDAINTLLQIEREGRSATLDEQEVLSKYVGWGGLADAFDDTKPAWSEEYQELAATLTPEEYAAARASTLNAHYTSPTVIHAIYEVVEKMGFQTGNILEPAMGVGNFFGCLPQEMSASKLYGVELDSITGRIAKQLYPKADITVAGFETTDRRDFFDLAVGNVPFGQYQVNDRAYNKLGFSIHDYFFTKSLDQVRPGGVIAFVTSRYTLDKQSPEVRKYIARRADFLGAIRLPNNAFRANAGTDVVSDIVFLQKRDHPVEIEPDWVHLGQNDDGFAINSYFIEHPEMILGRQTSESTQYGHQDFTVEPIEGLNLADQLEDAIKNIGGQYVEAELPDLGEDTEIDTSIPADPNVRNYSYTVVDGDIYYRENSRMVKPDLNATAQERVKGMAELRDCVQKLIGQQMDGFISDTSIRQTQAELNGLYDSFTTKYGLINSRGNALAFADDSSYYLLCSLEVLNEDNNLERKADMFKKRTIKPHEVVTSVDTASEALALSISEKARVDMEYMSQLTGKNEDTLVSELRGVVFRIPEALGDDGRAHYVTADEYLSGNVRRKLREAEAAAAVSDIYAPNVEALRAAQPKDLDASEIAVRLGATWIDRDYIQQFMIETFEPPYYLRRSIEVNYSPFTAEWNITGKSSTSYSDVNAYMTYGTDRANAYKILEDTLNLRDVRIYDTKTDPDGKERRVLNSKETTLAQQKQQTIKEAFQDWIWKDPERRRQLVARYNELFNSTRPREYDGQHITFSGMNPEISLREHQKNAVAHILYGGNTLLAHEVGAGKTFAGQMADSAARNKLIVETYLANQDKYGQTLVFAVNVVHAIQLSALFNKAGIPAAYIVSDIKDAITGVRISREDNEKRLRDYGSKAAC